ncbi:MAG: hypothetical protein B7X53_03360 [Hyphomonas sp. 34-62-18]|nr:MAG: hypothetical protein B7X53_03360 [Hyphomonas sp. 34-62-18]
MGFGSSFFGSGLGSGFFSGSGSGWRGSGTATSGSGSAASGSGGGGVSSTGSGAASGSSSGWGVSDLRSSATSEMRPISRKSIGRSAEDAHCGSCIRISTELMPGCSRRRRSICSSQSSFFCGHENTAMASTLACTRAETVRPRSIL